ncbi:Hpt domain-containing protein [Ruminococcaceae bacterium OttesenSCG-928-I18]|nr:Hpt domain-containing protein [Ruminococcaceae bacterium OttesenSCG-928-I18]
MSEKVYIDIETGLGRVRNNKKLYSRMLGLFLQSPDLEAFENAVTAGDTAKAAEAAHAIKGVAGNLGLDAVFEDSNLLMGELREGTLNEELIATYRADLAETRKQVEAALPTLQE